MLSSTTPTHTTPRQHYKKLGRGRHIIFTIFSSERVERNREHNQRCTTWEFIICEECIPKGVLRPCPDCLGEDACACELYTVPWQKMCKSYPMYNCWAVRVFDQPFCQRSWHVGPDGERSAEPEFCNVEAPPCICDDSEKEADGKGRPTAS